MLTLGNRPFQGESEGNAEAGAVLYDECSIELEAERMDQLKTEGCAGPGVEACWQADAVVGDAELRQA